MTGSFSQTPRRGLEDFPALCAGQWIRALAHPQDTTKNMLRRIYGDRDDLFTPRAALILRVLECYLKRFGDEPVRIFRSPGRINLRGMHVDTHGGFLNLMTHQREVVLVAAPSNRAACHFVNIDPQFDDVKFPLSEARRHPAFAGPWMDYITHPETLRWVHAAQGHWGNYLKGSVFRALRAMSAMPACGMRGAVGSDLPRGAALSSSHALCVAVLLGMLRFNAASLSPEELILAVRDAEWFTGARTGTSDQAAEILGAKDEIVNVALLAEDFNCSDAMRLTLPKPLEVLVINSHTRRNLSGHQLAAYTRNRFAYSMALDIVRQELRAMGWDPGAVEAMDRLARLTPEALGGAGNLYSLLERIPVELSVDEMRRRYDLPDWDAAYQRYFGNVRESQRPGAISLRGPLAFGIAESERAHRFLPALAAGAYAEAGRLMTVGHDGDRVVDRKGQPVLRALDAATLRRFAGEGTPIVCVAGDYGASNPVLDGIVDAALDAGALGASLTGAGLAGAVLALCYAEDTPRIAGAITAWMGSPEYLHRAGREHPLPSQELLGAVVVNHAPAGAGELDLESS